MGQRVKHKSWKGEGMEGRCIGRVGTTAETGNVLPGLESLRWLLSDVGFSSLISQGSLRRNQSSQGCRSSSDIN